MNEMIERVALAIGGLANDYCNPCTKVKILKCQDCIDKAKEVIAAMKEPTEEMLRESVTKWGTENDINLAKQHYQSMIEAALK